MSVTWPPGHSGHLERASAVVEEPVPDGPGVRPKESIQLDYEAELVAIVGKRAKHLSMANAVDCIAGYSCSNEGSVREFQRHHAVVFDQRAQPGRKALDIRHVGEDIVPGHQVRPAVLPRDLAARIGP